jgi:1,4-alpha-glucan branching enzyme
MNHALVHFSYLTGVQGNIFPGVRAVLHGSWDGVGRRSSTWTTSEMQRGTADDGCLCFRATVALDLTERGNWFDWGVSFISPDGADKWAIPTEIKDRSSRLCHRSFQFSGQEQDERYYLTHCQRLGANKVYRAAGSVGVRFAVWAPNAQAVEVVFGTIWDRKDPQQRPADHSIEFPDIAGGYIADNGTGIHPHRGPFAMTRTADGVWETDLNHPDLANFGAFDHCPYMFRVTKNDGTVAFRTDLYSRCQIGYGSFNPHGAVYTGLLSDLDGSVSCSAIVDPETVTRYFKEERPYLDTPPPPVRVWPEMHFVKDTDFWADEFTHRKVPSRIEDLIIYELHMGALGFGRPGTGTLEDAMALLDHITGAGVNAIELLPLSEFAGGAENWGYATSHHFAVEYGGGGRDQYKFFVKECHRRGIAVIMDVVYNHFAHDAERAEYHYDSNWPDRDIYYWYEGTPFDYTQPDGGYVDNMSTAYAPRYHEEMVRKLFISSAVALVQEFHVDGFRLDQTTSIHGYNKLHADGREVSDANIFGAKMLREFGRTLRMFKPGIILMAEDHSDWNEVTLPVEAGGMGFDARWYADFYHHLAGDTDKGTDFAKLLYAASRYQGQPLAMDFFAGALSATGNSRVVYSESHDEAGNSKGPLFDPQWDGREADKKYTSHRGIVVAVNAAPLFGETRRYAEARCRFAYAVTVLSAGTPMFLFGEEVGAERRFKYNAVLQNKEDLAQLQKTSGAQLYRFYGDVNSLRLSWPALRSRAIDVVYVHNANRVIVFQRWDNGGHFLIVASLNDQPFDQGYCISSPRLQDGTWEEIFNSDASIYGGMNVGNFGGRRTSGGGSFNCNIPANGLIVFRRA